jgi:hypothetical protein
MEGQPYSASRFNPTAALDLQLVQFGWDSTEIRGGVVNRERNRTEWQSSGGGDGDWRVAATHSGDCRTEQDARPICYQQLAVQLDEVAPNISQLYLAVSTRDAGCAIQSVSQEQLKLTVQRQLLAITLPTAGCAATTSTCVRLLHLPCIVSPMYIPAVGGKAER